MKTTSDKLNVEALVGKIASVGGKNLAVAPIKPHDEAVTPAKQETAPKAEKPKIEPKPSEKVETPKAKPKSSEKSQNTPKKDEAKTYCLRLPQEAIDEIDAYKKLFGMTAGEFFLKVLNRWKESNPDAVKQLSIIKNLKEQAL